MIKKIDVFMPPRSQYGVLNLMTKQLHCALQKAGIKSDLLVPQYDNPEPFLESIFSNPPDCTLSINGLLPDPKGNFFCDAIKIPHVALLVDSPNQFIPLAQSKRNIITCPDAFAVNYFKGLGHEHTLFLPHGVDPDIKGDFDGDKEYDVLFCASCIDYDAIKDEWAKKHPPEVSQLLHDAAEVALKNRKVSYVEALVAKINQALQSGTKIAPETLNLAEMLDELEMYIRGVDRVALVREIKDIKVDVFGAEVGKKGWSDYLGDDHSNVTVHGPVPYEEALILMKKSKVVLNSSPWISHGTHERALTAMVSGAVALTDENSFMASHFKKEEEVLFYQYGEWEAMNESLQRCLQDDALRKSMAKKSQQCVFAAHTWDHRVQHLLHQLPPIVEALQKLDA